MAGCPNRKCTRWADAVALFIITKFKPFLVWRSGFCIGEGELGDGKEPIDFCPFCGSKLTPPEEEVEK